MHQSAFRKAQLLRRSLLAPFEGEALSVLDVGSAVVADGHMSNREAFANPNWPMSASTSSRGRTSTSWWPNPMTGARCGRLA